MVNRMYKKILLTGATGFLGIHILYQLLIDTQADIVCLVRAKDDLFALKKLKEQLAYYFEEDIFEKWHRRIYCVKGDVTEKKLGINSECKQQENLEGVDVVIHAAAIVKHFGVKEEIYTVNCLGTRNVIDFCLEHRAFLMYISSMSVSGRFTKYQEKTCFTELDTTYEGQKELSNIYVKSKRVSEKLILDAWEYGLNGMILRIGSLTGRYQDGCFQKNAEDNAFYSRIKTIAEGKLVPKSVLENMIDFTPVDYCSQAIVKILKSQNRPLNICHLQNNNSISYRDLLGLLEKLGRQIEIVDVDRFLDFKRRLPDKRLRVSAYTGFCLYMRKKWDDIFRYKISVSCERTEKYLRQLEFEWPVIDAAYLQKVLDGAGIQ